MDNNISYQSIDKINLCLICLENIDDSKFCKCIKCNIILHNLCEETYRGHKRYCEMSSLS